MQTGERARGALYGLAIGDALGMPTQMLSRRQITERWGAQLHGFEPAPPGHPIAAGMPAGSVTDDTEQAVLLGRLLVAGHGAVDHQELATALVDWERLREPGAWDLVRVEAGDAVYVSGYGLVPPESGQVLGAWAAGLPPEVLLFVDPGPLVADIPAAVLDPVLARCDWWSCNRREAALLTGRSDPAEAARHLVRRTGQADVIVRTGPDGCVVAMRVPGPVMGTAMAPGLSLSQIPAPAVTVVDTTGAGDAHSGVFLAGLAAGLTVGDATRRANAAAALTVTRSGAAVSPTRAELDQFGGF